jgi:hypothetical protein
MKLAGAFSHNNPQIASDSYLRHGKGGLLPGLPDKPMEKRGVGSDFFRRRAFLNRHVLEFTGFKDFPTFQTLDVFGVLVAADDLHARVLTLIHDPSLLGAVRRRLAS